MLTLTGEESTTQAAEAASMGTNEEGKMQRCYWGKRRMGKKLIRVLLQRLKTAACLHTKNCQLLLWKISNKEREAQVSGN